MSRYPAPELKDLPEDIRVKVLETREEKDVPIADIINV